VHGSHNGYSSANDTLLCQAIRVASRPFEWADIFISPGQEVVRQSTEENLVRHLLDDNREDITARRAIGPASER